MEHKTLFLLGYGIVTMVILVFCLFVLPWLFRRFFNENSWTVGKQIFFLLIIVLLIGTGNYLYSSVFFSFSSNRLKDILFFQGFTLLVAIFPIAAIIFFSYNRYLKKNLSEAVRMNSLISNTVETPKESEQKNVKLISSNRGEDPLEIRLDELFFIRSDGNYLEIHYAVSDRPQQRLIRNTLTETEKQLHKHFPPLMRCHRSFIVNLEKVEKVQGNAQGLLLNLKNHHEKIPVSRKYIPKIKNSLY
jgi:ABC-type multidrug transport system fused ATPase/permease subunit